jgi:hypothetical protein
MKEGVYHLSAFPGILWATPAGPGPPGFSRASSAVFTSRLYEIYIIGLHASFARAAAVLSPLSRESAEALEKGLTLCRRQEWDKGLRLLGLLAEGPDRSSLPGLFYSYLGYGIARVEGKVAEGLKLCQHSIKVEFYQPDNYLNLARTHLLTRNRKEAVDAIRRGLKIDPNHVELTALSRDLGVRRPPVIGFLSRDNFLNRLLGAMRHRFKGTD